MSSLLKIAGKSPDNKVKGINVENNGNLLTEKKWNTLVKVVCEAEPKTTDTIRSTPLDISEFGAVSVRITNYTDAEMKFGFYLDVEETGNGVLRDMHGTILQTVIPANTACMIVTPDDFPVMQWLKWLKLYLAPKTTPTNGKNVKITAVCKR